MLGAGTERDGRETVSARGFREGCCGIRSRDSRPTGLPGGYGVNGGLSTVRPVDRECNPEKSEAIPSHKPKFESQSVHPACNGPGRRCAVGGLQPGAQGITPCTCVPAV